MTNPVSKQEAALPLDGALVIDKPEGLTSHDVVARLRRILRTKKIGHTGTLDPFATGVLVMLVGKATRLARYLDKDRKSYHAVIRFGFETDTGDRDGKRTASAEVSYDQSEIAAKVRSVLPDFTGAVQQVPPMYSAKKIQGRKLYELAREGVVVERKPIDINIYKLETVVRKVQDPLELAIEVTCSAGTYIRTLAEDIGRRIEIPCHLKDLRRTAAGRFKIEDSITLEILEKLSEEGRVDEVLFSMNETVSQLHSIELSDSEVELISHGMKIDARSTFDSVRSIRLTGPSGELVAIGESDEFGKIQPKAVFISN